MAHQEFASNDTTPMDRFMQLTKTAKVLGHRFRALTTDRVPQLETPRSQQKSDISGTPQRAFFEASMQHQTGMLDHTPLVSSPQSALAQGTLVWHRPVSVMADFCSDG